MKYTIENGFIIVMDDNGQKWTARYPYDEGETVRLKKIAPTQYSAEFVYRSKGFGDLNSAPKVGIHNCKNTLAALRFALADGTEMAALRVAERTFITLDCIGRSSMDSGVDFDGVYEESELREYLKDRVSLFPQELRDRMMPWENGDYLRLPKAEEIFSPQELRDASIPYDESIKQWDVMKDMRNRIAVWENKLYWYWCENKVSASFFAICSALGLANRALATTVFGVRPVFHLSSI